MADLVVTGEDVTDGFGADVEVRLPTAATVDGRSDIVQLPGMGGSSGNFVKCSDSPEVRRYAVGL